MSVTVKEAKKVSFDGAESDRERDMFTRSPGWYEGLLNVISRKISEDGRINKSFSTVKLV